MGLNQLRIKECAYVCNRELKHSAFVCLVFIGIFMMMALICLPFCQKAWAKPNLSQAQAAVDSYIDTHQELLYGLAVYALDGNNTVAEGYYGTINFDTDEKVSSSSVFDWGQISELLVWVSVYQLYEQGKIDLDEDIQKYLPTGMKLKLRYKDAISMRRLMTHTAGFDEPLLDILNTQDSKDVDLRAALENYPVQQAYKPARLVSRSAYDASLAALVVSEISGKSFEDYVQDHIFRPLRMNSTAYITTLDEKDPLFERRLSQGCYTQYGLELGNCLKRLSLYPSLSVTGTPRDLMRLVRGLLQVSSEYIFARPETYTAFWTPKFQYPHAKRGRAASGFLRLSAQDELWYILGNSSGMTANLEVSPADKVAVLTMSNVREDDSLIFQIPDLFFARPSLEKSAGREGTQMYKGVYQIAGTAHSGPTKLLGSLKRLVVWPKDELNLSINARTYEQVKPDVFMNLVRPQDIGVYTLANDSTYNTILITARGDAYKLNWDQVIFEIFMVSLWILSSLSALVLCVLTLYRHYRARRRGVETAYLRISFVLNALQLAETLVLLYGGYLLVNLTSSVSLKPLVYVSYTYLVLAMICALLLVRNLISQEARAPQKILKLISLLSTLVFMMNLFYWNVVF